MKPVILHNYRPRSQKGAALIVVLILTAIISTVALAMANKAKTDILIAKNDHRAKQALFVANAGFSHVFQYLENSAKTNSSQNLNNELASNGIGGTLAAFGSGTLMINSKQYREADFGDDKYYVRIQDNNDDNDQSTDVDDQVWFHAIGRVNSSEREIHGLVQAGFEAPGMFGKTRLELTGSGDIDSYDGGTYGSIGSPPGSDATVGSNVEVELAGSADLSGSVESGGIFYTTGGGSSVSGTVATGVSEISLPPVSPCTPWSAVSLPGYNSTTGNLIVSSGTVVLTEANYCFNNIIMSGGKIESASGTKVTITTNGVISVTGGEISSASNNAAFLAIRSSYAGSTVNKFRGNADMYFTFYAPDAKVELLGNGDFFGTMVANDHKVSGSVLVHVDTSLTKILEFQILGWREIRRRN